MHFFDGYAIINVLPHQNLWSQAAAAAGYYKVKHLIPLYKWNWDVWDLYFLNYGKSKTHTLMLYSFQKVYYDIIYHNKSCTKVSLDAAFIPIAIPLDAQHRAQIVLGSLSAPAQGLLVNNWVGSDAEIKGKL